MKTTQKIINLGVAAKDEYLNQRKHLDQFFNPKCKLEEEKTIISPSKNYSLTIEKYDLGENYWNYTKGIIKDLQSGNIITEVKRNYSYFWHTWITHQNGNEYLFCGEDYQGQTLVNLTENKIINFFPESGFNGAGFCWSVAYPSPDSKILVVDGCYWGSTYELVFYDFSSPEEMPYKELKRFDYINEVKGWSEEGVFEFSYDVEIRKSDGVLYEELSDEEQDDIDFGRVEGDYKSVDVKFDSKELFSMKN